MKRGLISGIPFFDRVMLFILCACGLFYVGMAWTPSHFAQTLALLGYEPKDWGLVFGQARPIRSDDYLVATALIRNVVANHFDTIDHVSPYHESFRSFVASPLLDWSLLFRPQFWGFYVLPPAYALSLSFFVSSASLLTGVTVALRRFGASSVVSVLVALMLLYSQLLQVWWTQRATDVAFSPWPFLILLSNWRWFIRIPAIAYATAVWLLGEFYPPSLIAIGFAWVVLLISFARVEFVRPQAAAKLGGGLLGIALGAAIVGFYFRDIIPVMAATVYPGQRLSSGGGVPWQMLLSHLLPHFATVYYEPTLPGLNECEVGVVGTYLPLAILCFTDHRSLVQWISRNKAAMSIWLAGLALMLAWMCLPIPAMAGKLFLWDRVPPLRMLWGFGLALTLGSGVVASQVEWRYSPMRALIAANAVVASWLVSKLLFVDAAAANGATPAVVVLRYSAWELIAVALLAAVAVLAAAKPRWLSSHVREIVLGAVAAEVFLIFGMFNPIESAHAIFTEKKSPFLDAMDTLARANPRGWTATPGVFGESLNAFGVPAINNVQFLPDEAFFADVFKGAAQNELNLTFNRYAHIVPSFEAAIRSPQADVALIPIFDVATPLAVSPADVVAARSVAGRVDAFQVDAAVNGKYRVVMIGWAPFHGITADQSISVGYAAGKLEGVRAIRLPRIDVGAALKDASLNVSGFAIEAYATPLSGKPGKTDFQVVARDAGGSMVIDNH
ncbi:MAG: hypothetical protein KGO53_03070 [Alphaproteobacteria bacterium]|nr:hypothetical protein [Alphaproteobacteria bacterium]